MYIHNYTQRGALRHFGSSVIIASYDQEDGYKLNMCEPSGLSYVIMKFIMDPLNNKK